MSHDFRFRLAPLLDHRKEVEKDRASELASAREAEAHAQRREEDLAALEHAGRTKLRGAHHNGGPAGHLRNLEFILEQVEEQVDGAREAREAAALEVSRTLTDYSAAVMERRMLEKLRERMESSWRADAGRREQSVLDEVAVTRHLRGV
jgi:flagellar export protein FliJ